MFLWDQSEVLSFTQLNSGSAVSALFLWTISRSSSREVRIRIPFFL